jgi:hypothetical protein
VSIGPGTEYQRRLQVRLEAVERCDRQDHRVALVRLVVVVAALTLGVLAFRGETVSWWSLLAPGIGFIALMIWHDRVRVARRRAQRAVDFYRRGIQRIEDEWIGSGSGGERFLDENHPYAADLDLFGRGSLFELLSLARTRSGEETLARWLTTLSPPAEVVARQGAVEELRNNVDLREDLSILGEDVEAAIHPASMKRWGNAAPLLDRYWLRYLAIGSGLCAMAAVIGWMFFETGPWPTLILWAVNGIFALAVRKGVRQVTDSLETPERDLELLSQLLTRLESENFSSPRLAALQKELVADGMAPSEQIRRLARLTDLLNAMRNQLFAPIGLILMWGTQFAFAIERWRQSYGSGIARWLNAVGEIEALGSLAGYAYEHPGDPFPELVEDSFLLDGRELGHPLLPDGRCVRNNIRLDDKLRLLVVSGSNMSGKSTLLRTLGVNVVLGLAGAPVRARAMRLCPLAIGATLRIQDSLQEGASRFYAEITRLRQVMARTAKPVPVLFLIDEILAGTNSHDRAIGAEGVIRGLLAKGAVGLVTTHDLALARLADDLGDQAANVHFEDHLEEDRMKFDYLLREGVVKKSNALELMRSVGLDV